MANALFSKESLDKAVEETKKDLKRGNQVLIPAGFNVLEFSSVELTTTNKDNKEQGKAQHPMVVIGASKANDKEEKYLEVLAYYPIYEGGLQTKSGINANLYTILCFAATALNLPITELDENDPLGDLVKKLETKLKTQFRGIIGWEKSLNKEMTREVTRATMDNYNIGISLRRARSLMDTTLDDKTVKAADCILALSPRNRAILAGTIIPDEIKKSSAPSANDAFGAPEINDENSEETKKLNKLPF